MSTTDLEFFSQGLSCPLPVCNAEEILTHLGQRLAYQHNQHVNIDWSLPAQQSLDQLHACVIQVQHQTDMYKFLAYLVMLQRASQEQARESLDLMVCDWLFETETKDKVRLGAAMRVAAAIFSQPELRTVYDLYPSTFKLRSVAALSVDFLRDGSLLLRLLQTLLAQPTTKHTAGDIKGLAKAMEKEKKATTTAPRTILESIDDWRQEGTTRLYCVRHQGKRRSQWVDKVQLMEEWKIDIAEYEREMARSSIKDIQQGRAGTGLYSITWEEDKYQQRSMNAEAVFAMNIKQWTAKMSKHQKKGRRRR